MNRKIFEVQSKSGKQNYSVILVYEEGKIIDALCDCRFGSLFPDNYQHGGQLCRHIKEILKNEKK